MDIQQRIVQWENMTQADPENSMGWFSLGTAYKEADRPKDAAAALRRAIELDPGLSRAYQLLAQVLIHLDEHQEAGQVLTTGYVTAAERGDVMPQRAMESLLQKLGLPVPQVKKVEVEQPLDDKNMLVDRRSGKPGHRMPDQPMRGNLGKYIYDHFTAETWKEWLGMGTKVINELRLDFSNDEHQKAYEMHMMEWLGITQEDVDAYAAEQEKKQG